MSISPTFVYVANDAGIGAALERLFRALGFQLQPFNSGRHLFVDLGIHNGSCLSTSLKTGRRFRPLWRVRVGLTN